MEDHGDDRFSRRLTSGLNAAETGLALLLTFRISVYTYLDRSPGAQRRSIGTTLR